MFILMIIFVDFQYILLTVTGLSVFSTTGVTSTVLVDILCVMRPRSPCEDDNWRKTDVGVRDEEINEEQYDVNCTVHWLWKALYWEVERGAGREVVCCFK